MKNMFVISDTHFSHKNILTFKDGSGNLIRPFSSVEEMNETMIENWNSVVSDNDIIYHLGDVCFNKTDYHLIMPRLKGRKRLLLGNHDTDKLTVLDHSQYFDKIMVSRRFGRDMPHQFIMTHHPVHQYDLTKHGETIWNLHGHTHDKLIDDLRYINVCVEYTNYAPLHFDDLFKIMNKRKEFINA